MTPIALIMSLEAVRLEANSAMPNAPVVDDRRRESAAMAKMPATSPLARCAARPTESSPRRPSPTGNVVPQLKSAGATAPRRSSPSMPAVHASRPR